MHLISETPLIEKNTANSRTANALRRAGYATQQIKGGDPSRSREKITVFDWSSIKRDLRNGTLESAWYIGEKGVEVLSGWLAVVEADYPDLLNALPLLPRLYPDPFDPPECPICQVLHDHEHAGFLELNPDFQPDLELVEGECPVCHIFHKHDHGGLVLVLPKNYLQLAQ